MHQSKGAWRTSCLAGAATEGDSVVAKGNQQSEEVVSQAKQEDTLRIRAEIQEVIIRFGSIGLTELVPPAFILAPVIHRPKIRLDSRWHSSFTTTEIRTSPDQNHNAGFEAKLEIPGGIEAEDLRGPRDLNNVCV